MSRNLSCYLRNRRKAAQTWFGAKSGQRRFLRLGSEVLLLVLLIFGVCSTCSKNLIRRAENLLGALFWDGVSVRVDSFGEPRLDVTTRASRRN